MYAFLSGPHNPEEIENYDGPEYFIESYGDLAKPEEYVEITCRILKRAGVALTLNEVNRLRKELQLEELPEKHKD